MKVCKWGWVCFGGSESISWLIYQLFEEWYEYNNFQYSAMIFKVIFGKQIHLINSNDKHHFKDFLNFLPSIFKTLPSRYTLSYFDSDGDQITLKNQSDYQVLINSGFKTVKVNIREDSQEFMEITNQIQIQQNYQPMVEEEQEIKFVQQKISEIKIQDQSQDLSQIEDSLIQDKLRKMMPGIISKIKSEISEEMKERSRISVKHEVNNEPIITEEPINQKPKAREEPKVVVHERVNCDGCGQRGIIGIRYKCAVCPDFDFCQRCEANVNHEHPFLKIKTLKQTPLKIFTVVNHDQDTSLQINGQKINVPSQLEGLVEKGIHFVQGFLRNHNCQQGRSGFRGMCGRNWGCPRKNQPKEEEKVEVKVQTKPEVPQKQEAKVEREAMVEEVDQESIKRNANYLVEVFEAPFAKCLQWAQRFPYMTKEQLLNYCVSSPEFFN